MARETLLHAIAFQDGDVWIIQGIEYDIIARATTPADLPDAFMKAVAHNCFITQHEHGEPFKGIAAAPAKFRQMFEKAKAKLEAVAPTVEAPKAIKSVDIRLAAMA
jgi:hypothetical protein